MDKKSIELLRDMCASNAELQRLLSSVLDENIAALDSISSIDPSDPNIGVQALARMKAVEILKGIREEIVQPEAAQKGKTSYR